VPLGQFGAASSSSASSRHAPARRLEAEAGEHLHAALAGRCRDPLSERGCVTPSSCAVTDRPGIM
jgi:hypothetical protein